MVEELKMQVVDTHLVRQEVCVGHQVVLGSHAADLVVDNGSLVVGLRSPSGCGSFCFPLLAKWTCTTTATL